MFKLQELEALLFASGDEGISELILSEVLEIELAAIRELLRHLQEKYQNDPDCGLQIIKLNDSYMMTTKPEVSGLVQSYLKKGQANTLSQAALEVLSIVAYKQPITRIEIDDVRGVASQGPLQTLINKGLIENKGTKSVPGHPKLYVTTSYFLQYFGYQSLDDLPDINSFSDDEVKQDSFELFD